MGNVGTSTFVQAAIIGLGPGLGLGIPTGLLNRMWLRPNRSRALGWTNGFVERARNRAVAER